MSNASLRLRAASYTLRMCWSRSVAGSERGMKLRQTIGGGRGNGRAGSLLVVASRALASDLLFDDGLLTLRLHNRPRCASADENATAQTRRAKALCHARERLPAATARSLRTLHAGPHARFDHEAHGGLRSIELNFVLRHDRGFDAGLVLELLLIPDHGT